MPREWPRTFIYYITILGSSVDDTFNIHFYAYIQTASVNLLHALILRIYKPADNTKYHHHQWMDTDCFFFVAHCFFVDSQFIVNE